MHWAAAVPAAASDPPNKNFRRDRVRTARTDNSVIETARDFFSSRQNPWKLTGFSRWPARDALHSGPSTTDLPFLQRDPARCRARSTHVARVAPPRRLTLGPGALPPEKGEGNGADHHVVAEEGGVDRRRDGGLGRGRRAHAACAGRSREGAAGRRAAQRAGRSRDP